MSESFIEPESLNSTLVSLDAILDDDGAVRLLNKELSSYNFDGVIPTTASTILVSQLEVGMSFLPIGETEGALKTVVKVEFDDPEMTISPSTDYIISYLSPSGDIQSVTYDGSQSIEVYFEDWDDKVLGTKGWLITQEGNAIFSNVAVRGRIEATEGLIDGDLIVTGSLSTSATASADGGIVFDSTGIFAYDADGNNTFLLDATTGDITIFGTPGDDLLTGDDVSDGGTTIISANRITTGSVTGRVFRSNSSMTPTSGTGVYLDGDGRVRFSDPDATFTFDSNGLNVTSTNATMTFNSTGLSISGAGVSIGGTVQIDGSNASTLLTGTDVGPSGTTTISGDRITTGSIESSAPDFQWDGISTFSTQGTRFSVNDGQIISEQFRIDSAGNAEFGGTLVAADGTFSGTLSAGVSISSPTITGGVIQTATSGNRIVIQNFGFDGYINFYDDRGGQYSIYPYPTSLFNALVISGNMRLTGNVTIPVPYTLTAFSITGGGSGITGLNGDNIASGTVAAARISDLGAGKITSGTFDDARIPNLAASKITSGVFARARVENVQETGFTNAQTPLQVRTSDGRVGTFSSTINIKENIIPLNGVQSSVVPEEKNGMGLNSLVINPDNIFNITPVEYSIINEDSSIKEVGFIVEDLLEKWPAAVTYDKNGEPHSYNTNSIVSGLIYAVQTLKNRIDELESRIENG